MISCHFARFSSGYPGLRSRLLASATRATGATASAAHTSAPTAIAGA